MQIGPTLNALFGKVFIKNLKESIVRREFITKQCQSINLDFELIEAINGMELAEMTPEFIVQHGSYRIEYPASAGFLGMQKTVLMINEIAIRENLSSYIGLDDDCVFDHALELLDIAVSNLANELPTDWDVIILGDISGDEINSQTNLTYIRCPEHSWAAGSHGVAIRNTVYHDIIDSAKTYWGDGIIGNLIDKGKNVYKIFPSICRQNRSLFSDINKIYH